MPEQAISSGYISKKALVELLRELFGTDWGATLSRDTWILDVPRKLTEQEISRLKYKYDG
ncbi:hypothetical protein HBI56_096690 [Parastagonospora nodorum]|uniref:Uncharacterized protein n=2 Tax=Phaeosphaeria nodorum (strain SN15 / ATCC MYA-4574 / FGSC 10173) TaxID=321614 RepID=A0A7U2I055_PHANO|nr:hypothetical protein SNOG_04423 [Parastagonospora nodorum SN15]KAH3936414.1 hypothetical protein HBH54_026710 [Parastagonospora nodorum]EAT88183.2 hypothetical protein SNOG_04423 [Parastagonospora nodorum SN15]KAH3940519.1 hypothetical protein HBH53_216810 [Parastagonospora nodorum]KAH3998083.1 hypothetical protein HBI10_129480 [Parastagonospora nodorum]KAH4030200.1 hypothetical protein HBI13_038100 [Parastagonospora nodorum]